MMTLMMMGMTMLIMTMMMMMTMMIGPSSLKCVFLLARVFSWAPLEISGTTSLCVFLVDFYLVLSCVVHKLARVLSSARVSFGAGALMEAR